MTRDVRVGRLLAAALQQAIVDELPTRAEFYDHWLAAEGRRDGTLGYAPMTAVVGFLRTEGLQYARVVDLAGRLVAQWTWADVPEWRRRWLSRLPRAWRARAVGRRFRMVAASTCAATVARTRVARGEIHVTIEGSVFCGAREAPPAPLCGFYAALFREMSALAGLAVTGVFDQCRAQGGTCGGTFVVTIGA